MEKNELVINGITYVPKGSEVKVKAKSMNGLDYCIVRTYSAGVFAGYFDTKTKGKEGEVFNARRIWYWAGAASLSQLSVDGTSKPNECKFSVITEKVILKEIIEILPCTKKAQENILGVVEWKS